MKTKYLVHAKRKTLIYAIGQNGLLSKKDIKLILNIVTGAVRFELTTSKRSTRFQDEGNKPGSTKHPFK